MLCIHTTKECQYRCNFIHCSCSDCVIDHPEKFKSNTGNVGLDKIFQAFGGNPFGAGSQFGQKPFWSK